MDTIERELASFSSAHGALETYGAQCTVQFQQENKYVLRCPKIPCEGAPCERKPISRQQGVTECKTF